MSAYDPEPRGGRTAAAVLLAVALLAVLGAAAGYFLGVRHNDSKPAAGESGGPGVAAGKPCPSFIEKAAVARGAVPPMTLRLYVLTKKQNATTSDPYRAEVWICAAAAGESTLWYQGHTIKTKLDEPITGDNGILLKNVNSLDANKYQVTNTDSNGTTTYTVSPTELDINSPDGSTALMVVRTTGG